MADDPAVTPAVTVSLTVRDVDTETPVDVAPGWDLRRVLLEYGSAVYWSVSRHLNCGGRGFCGTCGARSADGPDPTHWPDRAAARWGYPRLRVR